MRFLRLYAACAGLISLPVMGAPPRPVDAILADYVHAIGGEEAIHRIESREVHGDRKHGPAVTMYWKKPDLVLLLTKKERLGYDGVHGWELSKKAKVKRLARNAQLPVEMDVNPLRYVDLHTLYSDLDSVPETNIDGQRMEVISAPNSLGETKLYFDAATHLLRRVEERGETSAYFTNTIDYLDYQAVDSIRFPWRILHSTTEPGGHSEDLRIKEVQHNVALRPEMFSKPLPMKVTLGGKR